MSSIRAGVHSLSLKTFLCQENKLKAYYDIEEMPIVLNKAILNQPAARQFTHM